MCIYIYVCFCSSLRRLGFLYIVRSTGLEGLGLSLYYSSTLFHNSGGVCVGGIIGVYVSGF